MGRATARGFRVDPIRELAERYDVIVLDHPHLGDALAADVLRPLDDWFDPALLLDLSSACVGPSYRSYVVGGRPWALPLDAATQVSVSIPEAVPSLPGTWLDVSDLAARAPVALSLGGPHAFLTFASVCVALGAEPATDPGAGFVPAIVGEEAIDVLARIAAHAPAGTDALNPIALLERMRASRDIAYIPLVYGYVNYAGGPDALRFGDAPSAFPGTRRGSTIGGTGIALTTRSEPDAALIGHLAGLLAPATQAGLIPDNAGQPSLRSAWDDQRVNAAAGDFYRRTRATIEDAWVRPRVRRFRALPGAGFHVDPRCRHEPRRRDGDGQAARRAVRRARGGVPLRKDSEMMTPSTENVRLDLSGAVATVTLARPEKLNAVTAEMSAALVEVVEWADDTDAVRAIVLTGAGERAFSAGSDIRTLDAYATPWDFRNRTDYCDAIRAARKPVIAAVNGYAFGGGLETALSCDIRLASTTASFAAPEIKLGWIGGGGMSTFLAHSIGPSNAAVMLLTGDADRRRTPRCAGGWSASSWSRGCSSHVRRSSRP